MSFACRPLSWRNSMSVRASIRYPNFQLQRAKMILLAKVRDEGTVRRQAESLRREVESARLRYAGAVVPTLGVRLRENDTMV
jgi:hypothetical protein